MWIVYGQFKFDDADAPNQAAIPRDNMDRSFFKMLVRGLKPDPNPELRQFDQLDPPIAPFFLSNFHFP